MNTLMALLRQLLASVIDLGAALGIASAREITRSPNQRPLDTGSKLFIAGVLGLAVVALGLAFFLLSRM